jgi:hypothetical protein
VWRQEFGSMGTGLAADGNGDLLVNHLDYDVWRANFGASATGAASEVIPVAPVPEPSSLPLLVAGAAIAASVTRRVSHRARINR